MDAFVANIVVVITIILQLFLCFKAKKILLKLLPIILLMLVAIVYFSLSFLSNGWDSLGYLIIAIFAGLLLLACGSAWIIYLLIKAFKKGL